MGNFNRGNRSGGDRDFRPSSFNRGPRKQVEMHQAVCSKCGKNCELPFRPTNDRPVFCSSCFENNRPTDSRSEGRNFDRSASFEDREMFTATCADCGSTCQVPFRPTNGKPVFCSNCFGEKKSAGPRDSSSQPRNKNDFEQLNAKLDKILSLLSPKTVVKEAVAEIKEEIKELEAKEEPVKIEKKTKVAKVKVSKKK